MSHRQSWLFVDSEGNAIESKQCRKDIAEMIWRLLNERRWLARYARNLPELDRLEHIDTINRKIAILREAGR